MDNKYFIPDITEIRVGYEGEINWNLGYENKYIPFKVKIQNEDFAYTDEISNIINAVDDGYAEVRTPYLTKEQIEAEGWTSFISVYNNEVSLENMHYIFVNEKSNYMLGWYFNTNQLAILVKDPSLVKDYYTSPTFRGECKDINTLRLICKLLGI